MKSIKKIVLVAGLLLFAGNFAVSAQKLSDSKEGLKKEQEKIKQDKDQAKEKIKNEKDKMKNEIKDKKGVMKSDADAKVDEGNDAATSYSDVKDGKMKILEEKLKKARTDKEREEIMKMIEAEKKGAKRDDDVAKNNSDADVTNKEESATSATLDKGNAKDNGQGNAYGKDKAELKGRDFGLARADAAKAKLVKKEADLAKKEELVKNGRARIANAKKRLAVAIAGGKLTEDQIAQKQAAIDRAESGINKLEASINGGKAAYAKQKATLSKVYDDN